MSRYLFLNVLALLFRVRFPSCTATIRRRMPSWRSLTPTIPTRPKSARCWRRPRAVRRESTYLGLLNRACRAADAIRAGAGRGPPPPFRQESPMTARHPAANVDAAWEHCLEAAGELLAAVAPSGDTASNAQPSAKEPAENPSSLASTWRWSVTWRRRA